MSGLGGFPSIETATLTLAPVPPPLPILQVTRRRSGRACGAMKVDYSQMLAESSESGGEGDGNPDQRVPS